MKKTLTLTLAFFLLTSSVYASDLNLNLCRPQTTKLNHSLFNLNRQTETPKTPSITPSVDPFSPTEKKNVIPDVPLWTSGVRNGIDERRGIEWRDTRPSDGLTWYYDEVFKLWWRTIQQQSNNVIVNNSPICST